MVLSPPHQGQPGFNLIPALTGWPDEVDYSIQGTLFSCTESKSSMRMRPMLIAGATFALILCLYPLSPLFVPVPPPGDILLERARHEKVIADRDAKMRKDAHEREQSKLKELFENRRDSTKFC